MNSDTHTGPWSQGVDPATIAGEQTFPAGLSGARNTLMWAHEYTVEHAAQDQLRRVAALPWTHGVRVMPDVHVGKGATVGSVIAMSQAVAPAAVGVDIGCGMTTVRTNLRPDQLPDDLAGLRKQLERVVPVGFGMHKEAPEVIDRHPDLKQRYRRTMAEYHDLTAWDLPGTVLDARMTRKATGQCGTLGGGNHFIELCAGADDHVWVTLHSGSRGVGNRLAQAHIDVAQGMAHNQGLFDRDLSVFLANTPPMEAYLHDLWWAQGYALLSRDIMIAALCDELAARIEDIDFETPIRCHHNYVAVETHEDTELIVTRKGAIRAGLGDLGVIPGSMGTGSYIVRGLGNPDSYQSASHGAGRRMSRSEARRRFTADDLAEQTSGIECRKDSGIVDELPAAYKDIDQVMADQRDLVEVVTRLHTLLCIKG